MTATVLIGDIGGTNSRLQLIKVQKYRLKDQTDEETKILKEYTFSTQDSNSFISTLKEFLEKKVESDEKQEKQQQQQKQYYVPEEIHLGMAGPVIDNTVLISNAPHLGNISAQNIKKELQIQGPVVLYNDFEIASYSVLHFKSSQFIQINNAKPIENKPIAVVGPGTGLGRSLIIPNQEQNGTINYKVWACEGGSCSFPSLNIEQFEYYQFLQKTRNEEQVILEHGATGLSIPYMYLFCKQKYQLSLENQIEKDLGSEKFQEKLKEKRAFPNKEIMEYGKSSRCQICEKVFKLFYSIFQTIIGDIMLQSLCYSGIFILGNIAQSLVSYIQEHKSEFLKEYMDSRKCLKDIFDRVPIYIVQSNQEMGLLGAQIAAQLSVVQNRIIKQNSE